MATEYGEWTEAIMPFTQHAGRLWQPSGFAVSLANAVPVVCVAPPTMLHLAIIDDSAAFLRSAAAFFAVQASLFTVAIYDSAAMALAGMTGHRPDLVLVDLNMPDTNGFELIHQIKQFAGAPKVIVVTIHNQPMYRHAALAVGADAFLRKDTFATEILPTIQRLCSSD